MMVANYQVERIAQSHDARITNERRPRSRQYDSFVVRLWQDESSDSMLRVELQHVQAGLSIEAVQVPLDWIVPQILGCLQSPTSAQTDASRDDDDVRQDELLSDDGPA